MSTYDYTTTYDTFDTVGSTAGAFLGGFLLIIGLVLVICLAFAVCTIIGQWKAFKKAGKGGWEAIIPIYNQVVLCQISGISPWWILIVYLGSILLNIIPVIGTLAATALSIYFFVVLYVSTARSFGKSDGYAAGLYFLSPIFWLLIGSKNTQYVGPKPMNDVVWKFIEEKILGKGTAGYQQPNNGGYPQQPMNNNFQQPMNNNFQQPVNNAPVNNGVQAKFCTACGYKVANGERFCPGCGKEII